MTGASRSSSSAQALEPARSPGTHAINAEGAIKRHAERAASGMSAVSNGTGWIVDKLSGLIDASL